MQINCTVYMLLLQVLNTENFSEQAGHLQAANVATFNQLPVSGKRLLLTN